MRQLRETIRLVAASSRPVLVTGPTGVGKELVVRAIHGCSPRRDAALLELNCGAFAAALVESELFGHERGSFTGADKRSDGIFSAVGRGTLFLDEIGELPFDMQAKLLRVLETGSYRRVGSSSTLRSDARVIAATHVDLERQVAQGSFREDLLYRLNVLEIHVPPLADRVEDIPALALHFASRQPSAICFANGALEMLQDFAWPGNVRQLRNLIDRLGVFHAGKHIDAQTLLAFHARGTRREPLRSLLREVIQDVRDSNKLEWVVSELIGEALRLTNGNRTAAARMLGVHRKVVERRLDRRRFESASAE